MSGGDAPYDLTSAAPKPAVAIDVKADFEQWRERRRNDPTSELFKLADEEKKRFSDALAEWESKVKPEHKTKVDIGQKHTWKEVLKAVDDAKQSYDDPQGRLGWLRERLRKIGDKAGSTAPLLDGWLGLLPSESEYGSVICGGIKLILGAAANMKQLRTDVSDALQKIPRMIERAERAVRAQRTLQLKSIAADLYIAVLDTLGYIVQWYKEIYPLRIFKSILKQSEYGNVLRGKMEDVTDLVNSLKEEAELRGLEVQDEQYDFMIYQTEYLSQILSNPKVASHANAFLDSNPKVYNINVQTQLSAAASGITKVTATDLLQFLNVQDEVPGEIDLSPVDTDRAVWFMRSTKLREWLISASSRTLLVNGNTKTLKTFPMASSCARLLRSLESSTNIYFIHYFCGGPDRLSSSASPIMLLQSLIGQLLTKYGNFEFNFIDKSLSDLVQDPKALGKVFRKLVAQLPGTFALFCVIDDVVLYDDSGRPNGMYIVLKSLLKAQPDRKAIVKFIIFSPTKSCFFGFSEEVEFKPDDLVALPKHMDESNQIFDELQWDLTVGDVLEELVLQMTTKRTKRRA